MEDTIAAIVTSSSIASVGIIRVSGKKTFEIIEKIFVPINKINKIEQQKMRYGHIVYNKEVIDEVLVSYFISPISFTRENVCEINCHGGTVILNKILDIVLQNGARMAEPGEFSKRAFLNGRIDLTQAEAVIDVINAKTEKSLNQAQKQLNGGLKNKIEEIEAVVLDILSDIEANIDYPEYDVEEVSNNKLISNLDIINNKLIKLEKSFDKGKILKEGINIVIIGKPNVGKSSILNALLGEERAIVTDVKGTTRDTIEEYINIKGIPLKIVDTAGIRDSNDIVEKIGIEKSMQAFNIADVILAVFDASKELDEEDRNILCKLDNKKTIILLNKVDLDKKININELNNKDYLYISVKENIGIDELEDRIFNVANLDNVAGDNDVILVNIRHKNIVSKSIKQLTDIYEDINKKTPIDIISIKIMEILNLLGEITGKTVTDEVISKIFSKFCLGK